MGAVKIQLYSSSTAITEEGTVAEGVMDVNTALEVLKTALTLNGPAHGTCETTKALDKHQAHLCVLASNCDEPVYVRLVEPFVLNTKSTSSRLMKTRNQVNG